jgi:two-component system phosphate regulon sensor histidine kinase PhoR
MYRRPHFTEYIMARLVTLAVFTSFVFSILFLILIPDDNTAFIAMGVLILGFSVFIYAIYRGAGRMQKELHIINTYLENIPTKKVIKSFLERL